MRTFPPGWATDLAVLEHSGSIVEDHEDHLIVRTPHNPDFHWGNCLFVTDEDAVDDARRWVDTFQSAFPQATWVAIGLTRMPDDQDVWIALGLEFWNSTTYSRHPSCPGRRRFPAGTRCAGSVARTGCNPWPGR